MEKVGHEAEAANIGAPSRASRTDTKVTKSKTMDANVTVDYLALDTISSVSISSLSDDNSF